MKKKSASVISAFLSLAIFVGAANATLSSPATLVSVMYDKNHILQISSADGGVYKSYTGSIAACNQDIDTQKMWESLALSGLLAVKPVQFLYANVDCGTGVTERIVSRITVLAQ